MSFAVLGALITVVAIFVYMGACVATIRLYTTRRYELKPVKHIVHPRDRHRDASPPLYYQFVPWSDYRLSWGNIAAIVFLGVALLGAVLTRSAERLSERPLIPSRKASFRPACLTGMVSSGLSARE